MQEKITRNHLQYFKGVKFINLASILRDPEKVSSFPITPKVFPTSIVTYKFGLPIPT